MCAKKIGSIEDLSVVGIDIGKETFHLAGFDRNMIEGAIRRFQELSETNWQTPPIPRDHLSFQTEAEAMAATAP